MGTRKIRVFYRDPDATDSSSSDEDNENSIKGKTFTKEITIPAENPIKKAKFSSCHAVNAYSNLNKVESYHLHNNNVGCGAESAKVGVEIKLPTGVRRVKNGRFRARIRHPKFNVRVWLGTYDTLEKATAAIRKKRVQFEVRFGCKKQLSSDRNGIDPSNKINNRVEEQFGSKQPVTEKATNFEPDEEKNGDSYEDGKLPVEVKNSISGIRFGFPASIFKAENSSEPTMSVQESGGGDTNADTLQKTSNEVLDDNPEKPECGLDHIGCPTSVLGAEDSRELSMSIDESDGGDSDTNAEPQKKTSNEVLDNPEKSECGLGHISCRTSVLGDEDLGQLSMSIDESEGGDSDTNAKPQKKTSNEVLDNPEEPECGVDHNGSHTSLFEAEDLGDKLIMSVDESEGGDRDTNAKPPKMTSNEVVDNSKTPRCGFDHIGSQASVFKAGNSSELTVSSAHETEGGDTNADTQQKPFFASTFEEWVRLGIINEYGQLLGEYSKLDEGLSFSNYYDNEGITGYY